MLYAVVLPLVKQKQYEMGYIKIHFGKASNMIFIDNEKEMLIITNYINMKRYGYALERVSRLLEQEPSEAYLIYLNAYCLYKLERYEEAIDSCKSAFENGYSSNECFYLLCRIHTQTDQYAKAESFLLSALDVDPQNAEYIAYHGYLMMLSGKNYRALELINQALEIDPENLSALHYKFYYYLQQDDSYGIKSKLIDKYFSLSTDESDRFLKAGLLDYHSYNYDSAEENFRQAFQLDPTNMFVLRMLEMTNRKPRFFFRWKRVFRNYIMRKLNVPRTVLKTKWILFKCVGFTRDTIIFVAIFVGLILLLCLMVLKIFF